MKVNREGQYMVDVLLLDVPHAVWTSWIICIRSIHSVTDYQKVVLGSLGRSRTITEKDAHLYYIRPLGSALR